MQVLNRPPINTNYNDEHYNTLVQSHVKADRNYNTQRDYNSIPIRSTVVVQREDAGLYSVYSQLECTINVYLSHMHIIKEVYYSSIDTSNTYE